VTLVDPILPIETDEKVPFIISKVNEVTIPYMAVSSIFDVDTEERRLETSSAAEAAH
jgi:hypothetical protein